MKRIKLRDEFGLDWIFLQDDVDFKRLSAAKLFPDEYACWRDHLFIGLTTDLKDEAKERLEKETTEACNAIDSDPSRLGALLHACKAYTTLNTIADQDSPDTGEVNNPKEPISEDRDR